MRTGDIKFSVEPLSEDVLQFYSRPDLARGVKIGDVHWTFSGNASPFCVARRNDEIVGLSAYIQRRMKFGDRQGVGLQAVDSFVLPDMRGRGLFPQMARIYADHAKSIGADLIFGFPNDAAAPIWFDKLGWKNLGQAPFLIRPLRAGFFLRKLRLAGDFPIPVGRGSHGMEVHEFGEWANRLWQDVSQIVQCAVLRDREFLQHRLFGGPHGSSYRVVTNHDRSVIVATRQAEKHGGRIAYVMEALGGSDLADTVRAELSLLRQRGVEVALAWSYPWSPNYAALRRCGFLPLGERLRPVRLWFGGIPLTEAAKNASDVRRWRLSYLDADTI